MDPEMEHKKEQEVEQEMDQDTAPLSPQESS
jgi:hypothetical protein